MIVILSFLYPAFGVWLAERLRARCRNTLVLILTGAIAWATWTYLLWHPTAWDIKLGIGFAGTITRPSEVLASFSGDLLLTPLFTFFRQRRLLHKVLNTRADLRTAADTTRGDLFDLFLLDAGHNPEQVFRVAAMLSGRRDDSRSGRPLPLPMEVKAGISGTNADKRANWLRRLGATVDVTPSASVQRTYRVTITSLGSSPTKVTNVLGKIANVGHMELAGIVDNLPYTITATNDRARAHNIKKLLELHGASVQIDITIDDAHAYTALQTMV